MQSTPNSKNDRRPFPGQARFTRSDSTFRWKIYCTGHSGKVTVLDGYSKGTQHREPDDKIYLLEGTMIRLWRSGYWKPDKIKIEWYENDLLGIEDHLVLTTTPTSYHFGTSGKYCTNERLIKFMAKFYEAHRRNEVSNAIRGKAWRQKDNSVFDLSAHRFKNNEELVRYTLGLAVKGYAQGRIEHFYIQYTQKNFPTP